MTTLINVTTKMLTASHKYRNQQQWGSSPIFLGKGKKTMTQNTRIWSAKTSKPQQVTYQISIEDDFEKIHLSFLLERNCWEAFLDKNSKRARNKHFPFELFSLSNTKHFHKMSFCKNKCMEHLQLLQKEKNLMRKNILHITIMQYCHDFQSKCKHSLEESCLATKMNII